MPVRIYTLAEAIQSLPEVRSTVQLMQRAVEEADQVQDRISVLEVIGALQVSSPEHAELLQERAALEECRAIFRREGERLAASQVILRDLATGLVDFPAAHEGRLVYLCWRVTEPSILYWHEAHAGAAGRRPIRDLKANDVSSDGRSE